MDINLLAVLLAAIAFMAVGFAWYSPYLFGPQWMKLMGITAKDMKAAQKKMAPLYTLSFVVAIVTAYVLSHVIGLSKNFYGYSPLQTGLTTAFWMWLGFIMPVQVTEVIFGGKKWALFGINTGYQLVGVMIMAIVLTVML